ncbi:hypothetical protein ACFVAV_12730 [Nocardia sp. NPDC057663]|uniref:hypothetical protein n=1 Tax=Nocardia sp. NPDC057663 TaxID=3346201 RepID=UPI00366BA8AB
MELDEHNADALHLEALEAEQAAIAAEATAEAARARARAARLRRRAAATADRTPADPLPADCPPTPTDNGTESPAPNLARSRHRTVVAAAALTLITAVGASGYLTWHHHRTAGTTERAAEFAAAAEQGVVALTSLDFSRAHQDVHRVLELSTGAFRSDFEGRAQDFTAVIQQSKVATEGRVTAAAVESMTETSAVVLVAATSQVTNSAGAQQEPRTWRLSVTVARDGDRLKMSKVEFVP